jgi:hypothetical protein
MGAFAYRIGEMRDLLAQVPAAANDAINQNFTDLVNRYADLRQTALNDLVDFMAKASAGNLGTQSKWQSRIARLRSDYQDLFRRAASDVMLPPAHQLFWATALDAEERFFDSLSGVVAPQRLDDFPGADLPRPGQGQPGKLDFRPSDAAAERRRRGLS